VSQDLLAAFPLTLELALGAMLLAIVVGIPAGVLAATKHNRLFDHAVMVTVLAGLSMPVFWTGILLIILLGVSLPIFPLSGVISDSVILTKVTGFPLLDSIITGNAEAFSSVLRHMVLPVITLGSVPMGLIARQTRSSMLEVVREDYVRTARAKGLREWRVIYGHVFKNGLIPVVTVMGLQFGSLLSGAVITETVFARPGLGRMAVTSILFRDYAAVQAVALVSASTFVVLNILVDLLYGAIDPRISRS
jgi:dipeptide transport system permease protein